MILNVDNALKLSNNTSLKRWNVSQMNPKENCPQHCILSLTTLPSRSVPLKGLSAKFQVTLHSKRNAWYLVPMVTKDCGGHCRFLGLKVLNSDHCNIFSCSRIAQVTFLQKPQLKIISFQNYIYLIYLLISEFKP